MKCVSERIRICKLWKVEGFNAIFTPLLTIADKQNCTIAYAVMCLQALSLALLFRCLCVFILKNKNQENPFIK